VTASAPGYSFLRDSLARWDVAIAPSELHGNICGVICGGGAAAARRWVAEFVVEQAEHDARRAGALRELLGAVVDATSGDLGGGQLGFEPLLPDEDAALDEQVHALAAYCHGFLSGLALGGATSEPAGDLAEILVDFAQISRAGANDEERENRDSADFALAQLKEYVRVGVQLAFEELGGRLPAPTDSGNTTTH
jgi:hypothetical protein